MSAAPPEDPIRSLAVVPDLFFATRIAATARAAGVDLEFASVADAPALCAAAPPGLLILDLHADGAAPLARRLKTDPRTSGIPIVGFYSHVEADLKRDAREAGVDEVLARSAFVRRLPALLAGGVTPNATPGVAPERA